MDTKPDDVVYLVAVRAREPNRGRAVRDVLSVVNLARASDDTEYVASVAAMTLEEAYQRQVCDRLAMLGFDFDDANRVVPVAVVAREGEA